jgi:hypothetical protein
MRIDAYPSPYRIIDDVYSHLDSLRSRIGHIKLTTACSVRRPTALPGALLGSPPAPPSRLVRDRCKDGRTSRFRHSRAYLARTDAGRNRTGCTASRSVSATPYAPVLSTSFRISIYKN